MTESSTALKDKPLVMSNPATDTPLLTVNNLTKHFPIRTGVFRRVTGQVKAVDGVSFTVNSGETLALVGESGCGKTTTGRALLRLIEPTAGTVEFEGVNVLSLNGEALRKLRRRMQIVFQDPYGSLNPRRRVGAMIGDPFTIHEGVAGDALLERVREMMTLVGLNHLVAVV